MFIDLVGIDGCGKSTIAQALQKLYEQQGKECIVFHGYVPRTNMYLLRDICIKAGFCENDSTSVNSLGIAASLMDIFCNVTEHIRPNDRKIYIAEKYIKDSVVYIPLLGGNPKLPLVYEKNMPTPDFRFILDVDPNIAQERIKKRSFATGVKIKEKETYSIMCKARSAFLSFSNEQNTFIIDANKSVEKIALEILLITSQCT